MKEKQIKGCAKALVKSEGDFSKLLHHLDAFCTCIASLFVAG